MDPSLPAAVQDGTTANGGEAETKPPPDSPRQPTMSLPSDTPAIESAVDSPSDLHDKDGCRKSVGSRARRGSATMRSFLQRVMRSQSESHIRVTPTPTLMARVASSTGISKDTVGSRRESPTRDVSEVATSVAPFEKGGIGIDGGDADEDGDGEDEADDLAAITFVEADLVADQQRQADTLALQRRHDEAAGLCDVFLNSSLQLLQVQSDTKQRVRQLWTCAQKLRWENQLSESGLELLHQELLNVMKVLTVEKLEGARHIKAGYLTLIQAPPAVVAANIMQRGAAAATKSLLFGGAKSTIDQRVWVSLSEEQCRLEFVPARSEDRSPPPVAGAAPSHVQSASDASSTTTPAAGTLALQPLPAMNGTAGFPGIGKFKLPTSISWLLSEPLPHQQKEEETAWIGRTTIKLQGCQVRRIPVPTTAATTGGAPTGERPRIRFQLLVPNSDPSCASAAAPSATASPAVVPDANAVQGASSYGIYVFEVPPAESPASAEQEREDWLRAIDRVCVFHLYALEQQLRDASFMLQFREILATSFPVCVPLTWLRNRVERMPPTASGAAMSAQQQATYQYQQLQRRSSRNLSMVQIVKDLERDRILVDRKLLISSMGQNAPASEETTDSLPSATTVTTLSDGTTVIEHDSVSEIVKYLVGKAMAFARRTAHPKTKSCATTGRPPVASSSFSSSSASPSASALDVMGPMSPSSRLTKFTEVRALAFVERVLRGSSRTQSGGDIYDAISFFCQQRSLTICPMSHDAHPVQLNVVEDDAEGLFHIEIEVSMQFKAVELAVMASRDSGLPDLLSATTPREWAVLEGTLMRQFTLGKLSEPGSVVVKYLPDPDCPDHSAGAIVQDEAAADRESQLSF